MASKLPPEEIRRLNSMCYFIEETKKAGIKPNAILDIGSYNGAHLQELGKEFDVDQDNMFAFEPHPGMVPHAKRRVKNVLECAISDFDGEAEFNAIDLTQQCHHGCSSLYSIGRPHIPTKVKVHRIDTLIENGTLPKAIDMVKIDVEGKSYEVLDGFGKYLKQVKILHVECETKDCYGGQKTEKDIVEFMDKAGFRVVHSLHIPEFQDDLIFLNNNIK